MKINRQNWILAPMSLCGIVILSLYNDDRPLHRIGLWALALSLGWVMIRDYTDTDPAKMTWWLAGIYAAFALSFLLFLPATPEYLWWRIGGALGGFGFALYVVLGHNKTT